MLFAWLYFLALLFIGCVVLARKSMTISTYEAEILREEARDSFLHAFDSYMKYGFPYDEVRPLSCEARKYDQRERGTLDDSLGGYMLTLVDSLDTLIILREFERFQVAISLLKNITFVRNVNVSVFETNIRIIGGLLSAHQLALYVFSNNRIYDGKSLLNYAIEIGKRILPAFDTRTGIPVHRVNLATGKIHNETKATCPAAGGTFLLELGLLSRLSGDPRYEVAATKALNSIWERRSKRNLLGSMIDTNTGKWLGFHSSLGAGADSFFETMLKSAILLGETRFLEMFDVAYDAITSETFYEGYHIEVNMELGSKAPYSYYVSSLTAFWPSVQVLHGKVTDAQLLFEKYRELWYKYEALPDIYDLSTSSTIHYAKDYPLRPELIESSYYLYSATKDMRYVEFAKDVLYALQNKSRTVCGYASIANVETGELDDRMDSYVLAETFKYLFLLFDEASSSKQSIFCNDMPRQVVMNREWFDETNQEYETSNDCEIMRDNCCNLMTSDQAYNISNNRISTTECMSFPNQMVDDDNNILDGYQWNCIPKLSSIFSTEGHLFLIDSKLRPYHHISDYEKSQKRQGTCPVIHSIT